MPDLLIRNIDPHLKRQLERRARIHQHSLSEEARLLLKSALLAGGRSGRGLFTQMRALVPEEARGDDLVFELPGETSIPPDFE